VFFNKKDKIKKQVNNIDKLVTGLIIWWAVASIIWLSKKRKKDSVSKNIVKESTKIADESTKIAKKWYSIFGRVLVGIVKIFSKK
jgi:uncharacterized membrane protein YciS (DUF1049 family)